MGDELRKLGEAELEIMQVLWRAGGPLNATEIREQMHGRTWALATLITVLNRLEQKGFLGCERQPRNNRFSPLVPEEDYRAAEGRNLLERLYDNSLSGMVASFYDGKVIGDEDIAELQRYLSQLLEGGESHA